MKNLSITQKTLESIFFAEKSAWEREQRGYLIELTNLISKHFNVEELRTFCFRLGIEYDDLPAQGNENKARELVKYFERRNNLDELAQESQRVRPNVGWGTLPTIMEEAWQLVNWEMAARRYAEKIKRDYGIMHIFGQTAPVPLEEIFTNVYVLDKPMAWRRSSITQLQEQYVSRDLPEHGLNRQSGLEVVQEIDKLFILGKPGAGKTTFLKHVSLEAIVGRIGKVPIFISLKEFTDSTKKLDHFIATQFAVCKFPNPTYFIERLLEAGKVIVLFDGLDEVSQIDEEQASSSANIYCRVKAM